MIRIFSAAACGLLFLAATSAQAVTIDWVTIGNPGNAADQDYGQGQFGAVADTFNIGKYEVTNAQYVEFLNAVATTNGDPLGLYHDNMGISSRGGITRTGSGTLGTPWVYQVKATDTGQGPGGADYAYANKPVVYVDWYDTLRFANWLHNGQGPGDTETGAYTLSGGMATPSNGGTVTRESDALYFLPSEDEWYKAAYHDKTAGTAATYFNYPTANNSSPDNNLPSADCGNSANFKDGSVTTGSSDYPLTDVGAYVATMSSYGTFDQGGNVGEWNEALIFGNRGIRGGYWNSSLDNMAAPSRSYDNPTGAGSITGFRVASPFSEDPIVPEPASMVLGLIGTAMLAWRMRRGLRKTSL